ncbi:MAG: hypothetical protein JNN07_02260 [Verrucomicrobiales bacterium]|nr:hypothetical protein [Verrucomicrobiales bacterium]
MSKNLMTPAPEEQTLIQGRGKRGGSRESSEIWLLVRTSHVADTTMTILENFNPTFLTFSHLLPPLPKLVYRRAIASHPEI